MKIQVRHSVFETNSSSTHSLSIDHCTIDEAREIVNEKIKKAYEGFEEDDSSYFDVNDYIEGNTLILKGLDFESGEESKNVYYIVSNWMAKIQYMAMIINEYAYYMEGFEKEQYSYNNSNERLLLKTKPYNKFINMVLQYANAKGYNIADVKFDMYYSTWIEDMTLDIPGAADNVIHEHPITEKTIEMIFSTMMMDDYVVTYCDEAYHPYEKPETYII